MTELARYTVYNEGVPAEILIAKEEDQVVRTYRLEHAQISPATQAVLSRLKERILEDVSVAASDLLDPRQAPAVRDRLVRRSADLVHEEFAGLSESEEAFLVGRIVQEMTGLGEMDFLLADDQLEEIVINSCLEPVRVYHKKFGWLATNIRIKTEEQIQNFASIIGRKVGRQITTLNPLMDAHLVSGDRVNATLFPISTKGNTLTIRKFAKDPWTITALIGNNTLGPDLAALLWLAVRYELNVLVAGGTASGKTSFLNAMLAFVPPNQRILSIEDTRELVLPHYLHWTPLSTRQANPEGKGEVGVLDLLVNSLRMRPDRIVMGEIRRESEAQVLFEAMHTGHSVYATLHADTSNQVQNRLTQPPIGLPESMLGALHLVVVQYRQRRTGIRRTFEVSEVVPREDGVYMNVVHKWDARQDRLVPVGDYLRLFNELSLHTGMTASEIQQDLEEKTAVLENLEKHKIHDVDTLGAVFARYYDEPDRVNEWVKSGKNLAGLSP